MSCRAMDGFILICSPEYANPERTTPEELDHYFPLIREIVRELDAESGAPNMMDLLRRYQRGMRILQ